MNILFKNAFDMIKPSTLIIGKWNKRQYKILRSIGSGENGIVYLVQSFNKQYALKLSPITTNLSYEIQVIQRLNEARGTSLGFSVFDVDDFEHKGQTFTFYVMPYIKGISIEQYLYGKKSEEYLIIFQKAIEMLQNIHMEGLIIGDLKPEHIIIDPYNNKISFIDFGGVTPINEGVRQFTEVYDRGSWRSGNRKADPYYDLFSLAMIFVQLGIGKNKLLKIFKQSRSIGDVYDIIRKIYILEPILPILKGILYGHFRHPKDILKQLQFTPANRVYSKKSKNLIEWLFTSSFILFIFVFVHFIINW